MKTPPELNNVKRFLDEFHTCTTYNPRRKKFEPVFNRIYHKNIDFIQRSEISEEEIMDILMNKLNASHYYKGPEPELNHNYPDGVVYHFKYDWEGYNVYIKLKVIIKGSERMSLCMSFHD